MVTTLGIVEVAGLDNDLMQEDALALASRRLAGKSLLGWVVRRVTDALLLDQIIVVCQQNQVQAVRRLVPYDVEVFGGAAKDSLGRVAEACRHYQAAQIVHMPLSCPFVDPELIDRLVCTAGANDGVDYVGYFSANGRAAVLSKMGLFAEWCDASALLKADELATSKMDRSHPTRYVFSHPEVFQLRFVPIPAKLDRLDIQMQLATLEDMDQIYSILEALGPEGVEWHRIVDLIRTHPELRAPVAVFHEQE